MFRNYFKVAFKNLNRFRLVSTINLVGLTIGFIVCGMIYLFVQNEKQFDQFHSKADRLYRLTTEFRYPGTTPRVLALSAAPMGPHVDRQFAEVEAFTRLIPFENNTIYKYNNQEIVITKAYAADTTFFQLFDFQLLNGDKKTALQDPASVIISEKLADQLFVNENPLGKVITQTSALGADRDTTLTYVITGVMKNIPQYSHLQADAFFNIHSSLPTNQNGQEWHGVFTNTYFLLHHPIQNITAFEERLAQSLKPVMNGSDYIRLHVQPLTDVHLESREVTEDYINFQKFDSRYIYIFSVIAFIVLAIAGVNFTNLSSVIAHKRAKEIGIRKTMGASKTSIITQFLGESVLLTLLAATLSTLAIDLLMPILQNFTGRVITVNVFSNIPFLVSMLGVAILLGIIAGLYPAFYMSSFQPVAALKKLQIGKTPKRLVINSLVVMQFVTATILLIGTLVIIQQLQFLKNQDKGFATSQVITIDLGYGNWGKYDALKNAWLGTTGVEDVTAARSILGGEAVQTGISYKDSQGARQEIAIPILLTDDNYVSFYDMQLIKGRYFSENAAQNQNEYIINETFAKQIGWEDPIGQPIQLAWAQAPGTVVGVVKDFNFNTLHHKITPLCIWASYGNNKEVSVKVNTGNLAATLALLENSWKQHIQDRPFAYQFLDEHFATLYESETRIGRLMSLAAVLAVFIACMGLFGIAAFITEQRTKEIGIRKVLGASVVSIVELLSKDFIKLVFIAIIIATPLAWWAMQQWLEGFAYRIEIKWWLFVIAGLMAIVIALATVSFQAIRAAVANPANILKNE